MAADRKSLTSRRLTAAAQSFYETRVARDIQRMATDPKWRLLPQSVKNQAVIPWGATEPEFRAELADLLRVVAPELQYTIKIPHLSRFNPIEFTKHVPAYVSFDQLRAFLSQHNAYVLADAGVLDRTAILKNKIRTELREDYAGRTRLEDAINRIAAMVEGEIEERAL